MVSKRPSTLVYEAVKNYAVTCKDALNTFHTYKVIDDSQLSLGVFMVAGLRVYYKKLLRKLLILQSNSQVSQK